MERSTEVEELVNAWFQAASSGDVTLVDKHVSLDDANRLIGSDPGEWYVGGNSVAKFLRGEVEAAGGSARFTPADTLAFREGTVAWATSRLTITLADGRYVTPRWSAVFHIENGIWKFVQTHASIGVPNDEIGWIYEDKGSHASS